MIVSDTLVRSFVNSCQEEEQQLEFSQRRYQDPSTQVSGFTIKDLLNSTSAGSLRTCLTDSWTLRAFSTESSGRFARTSIPNRASRSSTECSWFSSSRSSYCVRPLFLSSVKNICRDLHRVDRVEIIALPRAHFWTARCENRQYARLLFARRKKKRLQRFPS